MASVASAYGPCGTDATGDSACPLSISPTTVSGSIANAQEHDYYVFYAYRRTHLSLTVNDTDDPTCSFNLTCSDVFATLFHKDGAEVTNTESSSPLSGISQPRSIEPTIGRGIYYVTVVSPADVNDPAPYTLSINAATTPAVHWPPLCTVPTLKRNTTLYRVKRRLGDSYCRVGRVSHAYSRHTRRGRVIGLRPRFGAVRAYETKVKIVVSRGRRRR